MEQQYKPWRETWNTLIEAISKRDVPVVRTILSQNTLSFLDLRDDGGNTALMIACFRRSFDDVKGLEIIRLLISNGARVDATNNNGNTPLVLAISTNFREAVFMLVDEGADVNSRNNKGMTSLMYAVDGGFEGLVRFLVERGADLNLQDWRGRTPLMYAAKNGYRYMSAYMVNKGAFIHLADMDGRIAEDYARENKQHECWEFLHALAITRIYREAMNIIRKNPAP